MEVLVPSDIPRLKKMKGQSRVWFSNPISEIILGIEYENYVGIGHEFLESRPQESENGEWIEHRWLLRGIKELGLPRLLKNLAKLLSHIKIDYRWFKEVDYMELEEVDSTDPIHYYFLISILSNGKDNREEKENIFSVEEYSHLLPSNHS